MAGMIGMVLGAGLKYEGSRIQQQREVEDKTVDMISQAALQDPSILQDKEMRGLIEKRRSKDYAMILDHIGQHRQAENQQFQQATSNDWPTDMKGLQEFRQKLMAAQTGGHFTDPQHQQLLTNYINENDKRIEQLQRQQDYEASRADRQQAHADTEVDRQAAMGIRQQLAQGMQGIAASAQAQKAQADQDRKNYQDSLLQLQKERDAERREQQTATFTKDLDAGRDKLLGDFAKLPDAAKPDAKPRVDAHNEAASAFYRKHAGTGAPTLLKWHEGKKGGIGGIGAVAPSIEAVPPQYVTDPKSGKSGWMDADGNLYVDQP